MRGESLTQAAVIVKDRLEGQPLLFQDRPQVAIFFFQILAQLGLKKLLRLTDR